MTEQELEREAGLALLGHERCVRVTAGDYTYEGWLTGLTIKRSAAIRATVEDHNGRLFIHSAKNLEMLDRPPVICVAGTPELISLIEDEE